jgi:hypothetical protein
VPAAYAGKMVWLVVSHGTTLVVLSSRRDVPFENWGNLFGDEVIASAILDRLLHVSHVFAINGPSYRVKDKLGAPPSPTSGESA